MGAAGGGCVLLVPDDEAAVGDVDPVRGVAGDRADPVLCLWHPSQQAQETGARDCKRRKRLITLDPVIGSGLQTSGSGPVAVGVPTLEPESRSASPFDV